MTLPKAKGFYYAFNHTGIPPGLVRAHLNYVRQALSAMWDIAPDAIRASGKDRLDEDAPFQLTAYETDSRTSIEAMVVAAKAVLPHLQETKRIAADCGACIEGWQPGEDAVRDEKVLSYVADGYTGPLTTPHRAWLIEQASTFGVVADDTERQTDARLAATVLGGWYQALLRIEQHKLRDVRTRLANGGATP